MHKTTMQMTLGGLKREFDQPGAAANDDFAELSRLQRLAENVQDSAFNLAPNLTGDMIAKLLFAAKSIDEVLAQVSTPKQISNRTVTNEVILQVV